MTSAAPVPRLVELFEHGLDAPICLTWELTYACNLACVHCLSSSGKRDPRELTTQQAATDRTPGLGHVPLLKWLFKRDRTDDQSTELIIFITPRIIQ